jgi:hypothetical protein
VPTEIAFAVVCFGRKFNFLPLLHAAGKALFRVCPSGTLLAHDFLRSGARARPPSRYRTLGTERELANSLTSHVTHVLTQPKPKVVCNKTTTTTTRRYLLSMPSVRLWLISPFTLFFLSLLRPTDAHTPMISRWSGKLASPCHAKPKLPQIEAAEAGLRRSGRGAS